MTMNVGKNTMKIKELSIQLTTKDMKFGLNILPILPTSTLKIQMEKRGGFVMKDWLQIHF